MSSEIITNIANISLALSLLVAVIFGIVQTKTVARERKERLTLETLRDFQTREFVELMQFVNTHDLPATRDELLKWPKNEQQLFMQFGQEMESLGLLVAERFINIDLVDKTLGSFVTTSWNKYKPIFEDIRERTPDPFLGEYFQWLSERIEENMRDYPRKPFHLTHANMKLR